MPSRPDATRDLLRQSAQQEEWWQVSLRVPADLVDPTTALFELVAPAGVVVEWPFHQGDDFAAAALDQAAEARVTCYLPRDTAPDLLADLRARLSAQDRPAAARRLETVLRRRQEWETAFHRFLQPVRAGRLLVRPRPCAELPREGEIVVDLEPGQAFGTGQHPTTHMALTALADWVRPGDAVLDFGSGSGVLSCAAARVGARRVVALDIDAQAVAATRRNARRNGVESVVDAWRADVPPRTSGPYDVVVANINVGVIVRALPALASTARPGGHCLLGGVVASQLPCLTRAVRALPDESGPLRIEEVDGDGEWRSLRCARAAPIR